MSGIESGILLLVSFKIRGEMFLREEVELPSINKLYKVAIPQGIELTSSIKGYTVGEKMIIILGFILQF